MNGLVLVGILIMAYYNPYLNWGVYIIHFFHPNQPGCDHCSKSLWNPEISSPEVFGTWRMGSSRRSSIWGHKSKVRPKNPAETKRWKTSRAWSFSLFFFPEFLFHDIWIIFCATFSKQNMDFLLGAGSGDGRPWHRKRQGLWKLVTPGNKNTPDVMVQTCYGFHLTNGTCPAVVDWYCRSYELQAIFGWNQKSLVRCISSCFQRWPHRGT